MKQISASFPFLFWPQGRRDSANYQSARKIICDEMGQMPEIIKNVDIPDFFMKNPKASLYYPVFDDSKGWWGELLGSETDISPRVVGKVIVSAECQLMLIQNTMNISNAAASRKLFAAEIQPSSAFFKKMNSGIAMAQDMLATDSGTVLALFSGKNQARFMTMVETTGNSYLGCIGWY